MSQCKKSVEAMFCSNLFQRPICLDLGCCFSNFLLRVNGFCSHYCSFSRFSWSYQRKWLNAATVIQRIPIPWFREQFFFFLISSHLLFWMFFLLFINRVEQRTIVLNVHCMCLKHIWESITGRVFFSSYILCSCLTKVLEAWNDAINLSNSSWFVCNNDHKGNSSANLNLIYNA